MAQRNLRMPDSLNQRLSGAARLGGYRSSPAFIRAAILEKLSTGDAAADGMEERSAATLTALATRLSRLETAIQAHFAFTDALARTLLLCVPEPPGQHPGGGAGPGPSPTREPDTDGGD